MKLNNTIGSATLVEESYISILNESGVGEISYKYEDFGETEVHGSEAFKNEMYAYCKNNPINYVDPSGHIVISVGLKAEAAAVVGIYTLISFNTDFKHLSFCMAAGMKVITNAVESAGVAITCFTHKNINGIKGLGFSTGISMAPIPYWDTEFGYTAEIKRKKRKIHIYTKKKKVKIR